MADITTQILIEIRDEIRATNGRLDATNSRLDRLERRQVDAEIRMSTALVDVVGAIHGVRDVLLEDRQLRQSVADHEQRLQALERARL